MPKAKIKTARFIFFFVLAALVLAAPSALRLAPTNAAAASAERTQTEEVAAQTEKATDAEKVKKFLLQGEKGSTNAEVLGIKDLTDKDSWAPFAVFEDNSLVKIDMPKNKEGKAVQGAFDLSGCVSLREFFCADSSLTRLDLSGCAALTTLDCGNGKIASLDVSECVALTTLYCNDNQLTLLDVSDNVNLEELYCGGNKLTALDVSRCTGLGVLSCEKNKLTALDVTGNPVLEELYCGDNQLASVDVSGCVGLTVLSISQNKLTALDVSDNPLLEELYCSGNQLTSVDVSGCAKLERFYCYNNKLKTLGLSGCPGLRELGAHRNSFGGTMIAGLKELILEYLSYSDVTDGFTYCVIRSDDYLKTLTVKCIGEGYVVGRISGEVIELYINPDDGYQFMEWKDQTGLSGLEWKTGYCEAGLEGDIMSVTAVFGKPPLPTPLLGGIVVVSICGIELGIFALLKLAARKNSFLKAGKLGA